MLAGAVLVLFVSEATLCNRFPKGESRDVQRVVRPCWLVFAVEWTWTRWVEPSGGNRLTETMPAGLVEWFGFVGVDEHSLVLVEEVGGCTSRLLSTLEAEYGLRIVEQTLAAVVSAGLDTQKKWFVTEQIVVVVPGVDLEPPAVVECVRHTEQNLG